MKKLICFFKKWQNIVILFLLALSTIFITTTINAENDIRKLKESLVEQKRNSAMYTNMFLYIQKFEPVTALDALNFWISRDSTVSLFGKSIEYDESTVTVSEPVAVDSGILSNEEDYKTAFSIDVKFENTSYDLNTVDIRDFFLFGANDESLVFESFIPNKNTENITYETIDVDELGTESFKLIFKSAEKINKKDLKLRYLGGTWQYPIEP